MGWGLEGPVVGDLLLAQLSRLMIFKLKKRLSWFCRGPIPSPRRTCNRLQRKTIDFVGLMCRTFVDLIPSRPFSPLSDVVKFYANFTFRSMFAQNWFTLAFLVFFANQLNWEKFVGLTNYDYYYFLCFYFLTRVNLTDNVYSFWRQKVKRFYFVQVSASRL